MLGVQQDSKAILLELDNSVTSWNLVVSGGVLKLEPPNFQDLDLASNTDCDCDTHSLDLERTPHKWLLASDLLPSSPLNLTKPCQYAVLLWR